MSGPEFSFPAAQSGFSPDSDSQNDMKQAEPVATTATSRLIQHHQSHISHIPAERQGHGENQVDSSPSWLLHLRETWDSSYEKSDQVSESLKRIEEMKGKASWLHDMKMEWEEEMRAATQNENSAPYPRKWKASEKFSKKAQLWIQRLRSGKPGDGFHFDIDKKTFHSLIKWERKGIPKSSSLLNLMSKWGGGTQPSSIPTSGEDSSLGKPLKVDLSRKESNKADDIKRKAQVAIKEFQMQQKKAASEAELESQTESPQSTSFKSLYDRDDSLQKATQRLERQRVKCIDFLNKMDDEQKLCNNLEAEIRESIPEETEALRYCGALDALKSFRKLCRTRILRLKLQLEIEKLCKVAVLDLANELTEALRKGTANMAPEELFEQPAVYCLKKEKIIFLVRKCMNFDATIISQAIIYNSQRNSLFQIQREERQLELYRLLNQARIPAGSHYFPNDHIIQDTFDRLVMDQRFIEGAKLNRFISQCLSLAKSGKSNYPAGDEVIEYLDVVAKEMCKNYKLVEEEDENKMRLLIYRYTFPLIQHLTFQYGNKEDIQSDSTFRNQCTWIRKLSLHQFDSQTFIRDVVVRISEEEGDEPSFYPCIEAFEDLQYESVPIDMLNKILSVAKFVNENSSVVLKADEEVGADNMFPFFAYLASKSEIWNATTICSFLGAMTSRTERQTELGYCYTTFEAAVALLSTLKKETFKDYI